MATRVNLDRLKQTVVWYLFFLKGKHQQFIGVTSQPTGDAPYPPSTPLSGLYMHVQKTLHHVNSKQTFGKARLCHLSQLLEMMEPQSFALYDCNMAVSMCYSLCYGYQDSIRSPQTQVKLIQVQLPVILHYAFRPWAICFVRCDSDIYTYAALSHEHSIVRLRLRYIWCLFCTMDLCYVCVCVCVRTSNLYNSLLPLFHSLT